MTICFALTEYTYILKLRNPNWYPNFRGNQLSLYVLKTHVYMRYMHVFYIQRYMNRLFMYIYVYKIWTFFLVVFIMSSIPAAKSVQIDFWETNHSINSAWWEICSWGISHVLPKILLGLWQISGPAPAPKWILRNCLFMRIWPIFTLKV